MWSSVFPSNCTGTNITTFLTELYVSGSLLLWTSMWLLPYWIYFPISIYFHVGRPLYSLSYGTQYLFPSTTFRVGFVVVEVALGHIFFTEYLGLSLQYHSTNSLYSYFHLPSMLHNLSNWLYYWHIFCYLQPRPPTVTVSKLNSYQVTKQQWTHCRSSEITVVCGRVTGRSRAYANGEK